jgi:excisionase family DNA binding protein
MTTILQLEKTELQELIQDCIRQAIRDVQPANTLPLQDSISLNEACAIIGTVEKPASKGTIYKLTMNGEIPFSKFGKRLVFSRKELIQWMESRTISGIKDRDLIANRVSASAKKHLNK